MGAVVEFAKKVVTFFGNVIERIVSWWRGHKEIANRNTLNYLQENHYYIQQSHNQTAVINVLGASKQKSELEDRVLRRYGPLSSEDRRRVNEILDQGYY